MRNILALSPEAQHLLDQAFSQWNETLKEPVPDNFKELLAKLR